MHDQGRVTPAWPVLAAFLAMASAPAVPAQPLEERLLTLERFERVVIDLPADVRVQKGSRHRVEVRGERAVVGRIMAIVKDGKLRVTAPSGFTATRGLSLFIEAPAISALHVNSAVNVATDALRGNDVELVAEGGVAGVIKVTGISAERLTVRQGGATSTTLSGKATHVSATLSGAGTLEASALRTQSCDIRATGATSSSWDCATSMHVIAADSSSVQYLDEPVITGTVVDAAELVRSR